MRPAIVSIFVLALFAQAVSGQVPDMLLHSIPPPVVGTAGGGRLGNSVAVTGDLVIAGAPNDATGGGSSGIVKIFSASTGALLRVIPNPQPAASAAFGTAVAVSGTRVIVGGSGRAFVFDLTAADPSVPILRLDRPADSAPMFGCAVAASGDTFVVGALSGEIGAGMVYVYNLLSPTPTVPLAILKSPPIRYFGGAVAIDGIHVVVGPGLPTLEAGQAFVFDLTSSTPSEPILSLSHPSSLVYAYFGRSVAVEGNRVVVGAYSDGSIVEGAGTAYVYDLTSATPAVPVVALQNPNPRVGAGFGVSVALSGSRLLVGAFNGGGGGEAYAYDLEQVAPAASVVTLPNPAPTWSDYFGWAVALSGNTAVAGAPEDDTLGANAGSAYAFDLAAATPSIPVAVMNSAGSSTGDHFGTAVAKSGSWLVVGSPFESIGATHAGAAYIYDLSSTTPQIPALILRSVSPEAYAEFGGSVAILGNRVAIGAQGAVPNDTRSKSGRVYIYDLNNATPETPVLTLAGTDITSGGSAIFGSRLGISGDLLAVSEHRTNVPVVYVFDLSGAIPLVPLAILPDPAGGPTASNQFGAAIGISGQRVVVGAPFGWGAYSVKQSGSAYVFDLSSPTPTTPVTTLNRPAIAGFQHFGQSVAISGDRVLVGAPGNGNVGVGRKTFLYDLASATPSEPTRIFGQDSGVAAGGGVALSATFAAVGDIDGGQVAIFDLAAASPAPPVVTLTPTGGGTVGFGTAMAFDGANLAVGAPLQDTIQVDKGYAYVFAPAFSSSTLPPQIHEPVPHSRIAGPIDVSLTLPETPLPGSVKLVLAGAETRILTLAASQETSGRRRFRVDPADLAAASAVARVEGGLSVPDGSYEVRVSYQDMKGNLPQAAAIPDVLLDRSTLPHDTTPPQVEPVPSRILMVGATGQATLPDYRPLLRATDNIGVTREVQQPPPGTALAIGLYPITFSIRDAAGNVTTVGASVVVRSPTDTAPPTVGAVTLPGGSAPGAGTQPGVSAGALLGGLGLPAISDERDLAALTTVKDGRKRLSAIYRENGAGAGEILAIQGGPVPGSGGATFSCKSLLDPVLAPDGSIAFGGKIADVKASEDEALWTDAFGSLQLVLREGAAIPGLSAGLTLKSVTSFSLRNGALLALVKLSHAKGVVTALDDTALVLLTAPTTGQLLARTGTNLRGAKIKTLTVLPAPLGSEGQSRSQNDAFVTAKATLADKRVVLLSIAPDGTQTDLEGSGDDFFALVSGAKWAGFGPPAAGGSGSLIAATAALKIGVGNVTARNDTGVAVGRGGALFDLPIREGNLAPPGVDGGPNYATFFDPVVNAEGRIAFLATLAGGDVKGINKAALFSGTPGTLKRIARLGTPALSATGDPLADTFWSRFDTVALPDGGCAIFVAKLSGKGVKASDKLGLWAEDANGVPRLVLRTGSNVPVPGGGGKTLTSFELLGAPRGSFGARRSYNSIGSVAVRAFFAADKSEALLRVDLP